MQREEVSIDNSSTLICFIKLVSAVRKEEFMGLRTLTSCKVGSEFPFVDSVCFVLNGVYNACWYVYLNLDFRAITQPSEKRWQPPVSH